MDRRAGTRQTGRLLEWLNRCRQTGPRPRSICGAGEILLQIPTGASIKKTGHDLLVQAISPASLHIQVFSTPDFRCLPDCSPRAYALPCPDGSEYIPPPMNSGCEFAVRPHTLPGQGGGEEPFRNDGPLGQMEGGLFTIRSTAV